LEALVNPGATLRDLIRTIKGSSDRSGPGPGAARLEGVYLGSTDTAGPIPKMRFQSNLEFGTTVPIRKRDGSKTVVVWPFSSPRLDANVGAANAGEQVKARRT